MNNKYESSWIFTLIAAIVAILLFAFIGSLGTHAAIDAMCSCRERIKMRWFKKKEKVSERQITPEFTTPPPIVLRRSRIKPTMCGICKCVYQASFEHIDIDHNRMFGRVFVECPTCGANNDIEFEEVNDGMS